MPSVVSRSIVQVVLRDKHVDLAGLQRREAVGGGQRHELDLGRIVENGRRDGAAEIDVKPGPIALRIGHAEAGQLAVGAAIEHAAVLHRLERRRLRERRLPLRPKRKRHCNGESRGYTFHDANHDLAFQHEVARQCPAMRRALRMVTCRSR